MAKYTAADIKALRDKTGAGMMDVKKAFDEADGDAAKAEEILRVAGIKSAAKREGRTAANGLVAAQVVDTENGQRGIMVEVNAETDFVAKTDRFVALGADVLRAAVESGVSDVDALLEVEQDGRTMATRIKEEIGVIHENIHVSHLAIIEGEHVDVYLHKSDPDLPPQVGVLVATNAAGAGVAHDVAVHIAAMSPDYLAIEDVPAEVREREERIVTETTRAEGKPEKIIPKIVAGRMESFYKEVVLLEQGTARDPKVQMKQFLKENDAVVTGFARIRVGEGAEAEADAE
ncbi:translation elongation factor Ts [Neoactinobaculum massilliense]|uniref:translation elongation factor Ts n=1 Tax=Neoactinobaculum massilliense TaxID=2364794 RepID=UPI000F527B26|nr:translation elongation factor Ts [Neoactinobaculum massilliense]